MKLTRFERKILAAMLAIAIMPLIATLFLGRAALPEVYRVGVNPRLEAQLERGLELYRAHFLALREDAERTADAVANDHRLRDALKRGAPQVELERALARYPNVTRLELHGSSPAVVARTHPPDPDAVRLLQLERDLDEGRLLLVTLATPAAPFLDYQRAGEMARDYSRLEARATELTSLYLAVVFVLITAVVVASLGVGIMLSRRVTRRVAVLAAATEEVGRGDLTVHVAPSSDDEIGDLTLAFNRMVRDLRLSGERIEYLRRLSAWQEFARRLAHEIRNPLTPIQLAIQEVHRAYQGGDEVFARKLDDASAIIQEEVATLRHLVGEFSAFAKLPEAELTPADLGAVLSEIGRGFGPLVHAVAGPDCDAEVELCLPSEPLPVRVDAMMLRRCVDNLVRNALQMHPEPGARVLVSARAELDSAVLEVCDNGPGVPPERRDHVFDPYYTTRDDGTGLGLAIVKKVALEHGGEVRCLEAEGGGACFRLELPLEGAA